MKKLTTVQLKEAIKQDIKSTLVLETNEGLFTLANTLRTFAAKYAKNLAGRTDRLEDGEEYRQIGYLVDIASELGTYGDIAGAAQIYSKLKSYVKQDREFPAALAKIFAREGSAGSSSKS
jgi:hypothetical protein